MRSQQVLPMFDQRAPHKAVNPVAAERMRLNAAEARCLELLKKGPATNWELCEVGGIRAIGRVWELKRQGWPIRKTHVRKGTWKYELVTAKVVAKGAVIS